MENTEYGSEHQYTNIDPPREYLENDHFPVSHLTLPKDSEVAAIVLLSAGSFSPPTTGHIRLLHAAHDTLRKTNHVSGAYMSPVNDRYGKAGLAPAHHRVEMCRLALDNVKWAAVTSWESAQQTHVPTYVVVSQLLAALQNWQPSIAFRVVFVCGSDLREATTDTARWPAVNIRRLESLVLFAVKTRDNCSSKETNKTMSKDIPILPWVPSISSTDVR